MVGIDSMILIYAGVVPQKKGSTPPDKKLIRRAEILLDRLKQETIVLPTIAVSELLVPVPQSKKGLLSATLADKFHCQPFDLHAAAIASDLWAKHKKLPADLQYKSRHVLKADVMIIGSVKAAGAKEFYSHDKKSRAIAGMVMDAFDLPTHSQDLFYDQK